jgi:hypothetical protein
MIGEGDCGAIGGITLTQSAVENGVLLKLYSLLINKKNCACSRTYTVCCREWLSVEAIFCCLTRNIAHERAITPSAVKVAHF